MPAPPSVLKTSEVCVVTRLFRKKRYLAWMAAGGILLQSSCNTMAAQIVGGILSSAANDYVRTVLSHWLNISGSSLSF